MQNLVTSVFQSLWFTLPQASGLDLEKELQKRVCDIMDVVRTEWGGGRVQWACAVGVCSVLFVLCVVYVHATTVLK